MRLGELVAGVPVLSLAGDAGVDVRAIDHDSRAVTTGSLFCCIVGEHADGHDFAPEAVARGAAAVLCERPLPLDVAQVVVADTRAVIGPVAATLLGHPSHDLAVVGVTGTNGKTTTTYLLRSVLETAGWRTGVIGTLSGLRTTPEAPELQAALASWRDDGARAVAMEVSSHVLAQHRVDGTRFAVAVFTNLSRDHLDYHRSMEDYFEAKARLFDPDLAETGVVNLDSPHGRLLRDAARIPMVGYSLEDAGDLELRRDGSRFSWRGHTIELALGGAFNVANALAAAATAAVLGVADDVIADGLGRPLVVPGRFELIDEGQPFTVIVDYAHTPDGLDQLIRAGRQLAGEGRVTVVFGCGGERDASKRPVMGEVAARLADRVVLTADNSRGEDTGAIIDAVRQGYERTPEGRADELHVEPDRRVAIVTALEAAVAGDVVLIAGKGHETTQTIGGETVPFDDREVARDALRSVGPGPGAHG